MIAPQTSDRETTFQMTQPKRARVVVVTSGKGGVGKTNIVGNLALSLAAAGDRVAILDANLSLANLDILFGLTTSYHIGHVLHGEKNLDEIAVDGPLGVRIFPAGNGSVHLSEPNPFLQDKLIRAVNQATSNVDWLLIDAPSEVSNRLFRLVNLAGEVIVVTTDEPTAIISAYAIVKNVKLASPNSTISLIVNDASNAISAKNVFDQIHDTALRILNHRIEYLGRIDHDPNVTRAVMQQQPVTLSYPNTSASNCFQAIARTMRGDVSPNGGNNVLSFIGRLGAKKRK